MDRQDFLKEYEKIEPKLKAFGYNGLNIKNAADLKDLLQETFRKGFEARESFREGTNFNAWMTAIMKNKCRDDRRKKTRRAGKSLSDDHMFVPDPIAEKKIYGKISEKELLAIIKSISPVRQQSFLMFVEGYLYQEIADELGEPLGTIKARIFHARKDIKAGIIKKFGPEFTSSAAFEV